MSTGVLMAQPATVSPNLQRLALQDTVVAMWLFVRPDRTLDEAIQLVEGLRGGVRRRSNWLHAISVNINTSTLENLRRSGIVRHLQPVVRLRHRPAPSPDVVRSATPASGDSLYGPSAMPYRVLNMFPLADLGFRARGVRIALLDTGFETGLPAFQTTSVIGQYDFVFNDSIVRNEGGDVSTASRHGTMTWSLLGANLPGSIIGIAADAEYILAKTEDVRSETRAEEDNLVAALEWADSMGATVVSISLGYSNFDDGFGYLPDELNGDVAVTTVAADMAVQRGMIVVTSAGNNGQSGARSITTPADGDSVIAVGATDSLGSLASFSSRGPTADGRIKPDLTAPGVAVFAVDAASAGGFARVDGTSFSAPIIAGAAALMRQIHPALTPIEIRDALAATGSNRDAPNSDVGWGTPDVALAATFPIGLALTAPADSLLDAVTPKFSWTTGNAPAFATPITYRVRIARDAQFLDVFVDSITTNTELVVAQPQRPGEQLAVDIQATAANNATIGFRTSQPFKTPAWVELLEFNDPENVTTRERRPVFRWKSPNVTAPPGPFKYHVEIVRSQTGTVEVVDSNLTATSFTPSQDLDFNTPYRWRVTAQLGSDTASAESSANFLIIDDAVPSITLLYQNFPNPFPNPAVGTSTTCVWFDLATVGTVSLNILDLRGHVVRTLLPTPGSDGTLNPGRYGRPPTAMPGSCDPDFAWDGMANDGSAAPQGVYIVQLVTPDGAFYKRIVYLGRDGN
jgi:subtilisin family serine protease